MHRVIVLIVVSGCAWSAAGCCDPGPRRSAPTQSSVGRRSLTFLTYNVLADPVGIPERTKAVMSVIRSSKADVIALQEVAPWFMRVLRNQEWVEGEYHGTEIDGRIDAPGGQYILSRVPVEGWSFRFLSGPQRRTVLVGHLRVDGRSLAVATTHMESFLEDGPVRAKQLDEIFPLLASADDAVVLGDFNFGDGESEETRIPSAYVDLWKALRAGEPGFTWDMERSPMARKGSFAGEKSRRIDRILLRSKRWVPAEVSIVGAEPISFDGELFPSDHFGLLGTLRRSDAGR